MYKSMQTHRRGIATKGSMLGPTEEKYIHPAEKEYMAFRPVFLREEKRRMWNGSRYVVRTCLVYDAGKSVRPEPFEWEDPKVAQPQKQRSRWDTEQLITAMCTYLDEQGPATAKDLAHGVNESRDTIAAIVRKQQGIFVVVGKADRIPGKAGVAAYLYDVAEEA